MMASVNVNGDEVIGTDVKQEAPGGFKFGFSIPTSCDFSYLNLQNSLDIQNSKTFLSQNIFITEVNQN
jgi:hypothetical protein